MGATGGTVSVVNEIDKLAFLWIVIFQVAIMTLCAISVDRYNVIVYPLNPSRSTTNMRSRIMIAFVWIYSLPFCGNFKYLENLITRSLCNKFSQNSFAGY